MTLSRTGLFGVLLIGILAGCSSRATPVAASVTQPSTPAGSNAEKPAAAWTIPSNDEIHALLSDRLKHNGVGIVVGVIDAHGRRGVAVGRSGAADNRRLDGATVFQIGSLSKAFVSLLLAEMVVRGEVALDDPAAKYLPPATAMPQRERPITLRDLATHVSGLPAMPTNLSLTAEPDPYEAFTVAQLYQFLASYELPRAPGAEWAYSNLGVSLLGRLLGERAGLPYEELLRQRVLQPLGMTSTSIKLTPDQTRRLAAGHDRYLRPVRTWEMANMQASGSLRSTVDDMLKLLAAYLGYVDTPLKAAVKLQLTEPGPAVRPQARMGLGISDEGIYQHTGGKQGYRTAMVFDPVKRAGVVILTNAYSDDAPIQIALHLLTGRALPPAPDAPPQTPIAALDRSTLDRYAGRYRQTSGVILEIARHDNHLWLLERGGGVMEFYPTSERDFFMATGNDEVTFQVDGRGVVTGVVRYGDGRAAGGGALAPRL